MSGIVQQSLQQIARGSGTVFFGSLAGILLSFIAQILIVRSIPLDDFGLYSLSVVIITVFMTIALLGFQEGVARSIAYLRGSEKEASVGSVIVGATVISFGLASVFSVLLFLNADAVAALFSNPSLAWPLRVLSAAIPFSVLISLFTAFFRGYALVAPGVLFSQIARNLLLIFFLLLLGWLTAPFSAVLASYLSATVLAALTFLVYTVLRLPDGRKVLGTAGTALRWDSCCALVTFSAPLLVFSFLNMVMNWTDTIMLGIFQTVETVALYNAAMPIAQLTGLVHLSAVGMYVPIASGLFARGHTDELGRSYKTLARWVFLCTAPIFFVIAVFAPLVLEFFYGAAYLPASPVVVVLATGFLFHTVLGMNAMTILAMGHSRFLMYTATAAAVLNIGLNLVLIPQYAAFGAAVASLSSLTASNIINSVRLRQISGIQPFTRRYLVTLGAAAAAGIILWQAGGLITTIWLVPLAGLLFCVLFLGSVYAIAGLGPDDRALLSALAEKSGLCRKKAP